MIKREKLERYEGQVKGDSFKAPIQCHSWVSTSFDENNRTADSAKALRNLLFRQLLCCECR